MKIRIEHGDYEENEVLLRCKEMDSEMRHVLALLRSLEKKIASYADGEVHLVRPSDVYYADTVDGRTFIYTQSAVLETALTLSVLQDAYADFGLLRISKSQVVNLHKVQRLKSTANSRIEVTLQGGEKLIVSRHYIQDLKARLVMTK